jgi:hypothetical protein
MKTWPIIPLVALAVVVAGCSRTSGAPDSAQIAGVPECADISTRIGFQHCVDSKSRRWVSAHFGKPADVEMSDYGAETWYYTDSQVSVTDETRGIKVGAKITFDQQADQVIDVVFVA